MPLYEFRCHDCGPFDQWLTLAECSNPITCPSCEKPARRIFSPPSVLSGSLRLKKENPEPQLVKRDRDPEPSRVRSHTNGRPWMIGH